MSWAERAADRSPTVQRSRARGVEQATAVVEAAQRLIAAKGSLFTTQELVKEAGMALRTFYRYFGSKDQLILAVIEHMVTDAAARMQAEAAGVDDPVERLRLHVTSVVRLLEGDEDRSNPRFMATEHWRLKSLYPEQMTQASRAYTDLVETEIRAAVDSGRLDTGDVAHAAWLVTQLVVAVFHDYAFSAPAESYEVAAERLWEFCLAGLGWRHPGCRA